MAHDQCPDSAPNPEFASECAATAGELRNQATSGAKYPKFINGEYRLWRYDRTREGNRHDVLVIAADTPLCAAVLDAVLRGLQRQLPEAGADLPDPVQDAGGVGLVRERARHARAGGL